MLRILSDAALLLGLPDPAPLAEALTALRPAAISGLAAALGPVEQALDEASGTAWAAADTARRSWSATTPAEAIGRVATGAVAAHGVVAQVRQVASAAAELLAAAVADGTAAIARAESAAANWPPLVPLIAVGSTDPVVVVLGRLNAELAAATARADDAGTMIVRWLADDPRDGLDQLPTVPPSASPDPTNGLSATGMDAANRAGVAADLTSGDPHRRALAASVAAALAAHGGRGEQVQLLVYDPDAFHGQGRVAIGLGDLSGADNVAVLTPGIRNSPMASASLLDLADRLREQAGATDPTAETAVVLWLGYDIPMSVGLDGNADAHTAFADVYAALGSDNAEAGGALLADDVRRFAAMAPSSALVTLVGHSMGSVVTSQAARQPIPVDNLLLLGSPGAGPGVRTAEDYPTVSAGHVFVGSHDGDVITGPAVDVGAFVGAAWYLGKVNPAPFGTDPARAAFGAQDLDLGPGPTPPSPLDPVATVAYGFGRHGLPTYLEGAGLVAAGAIVTGRYRNARTRKGR
jgi:hypothetical protein